MSEIIFVIIFLIPSMLGLAEILHFIRSYILGGKAKPRKLLLVYLTGDDASLQLKGVLEEFNWHGKRFAEKVIAVDCGAKDFALCKALAQKGEIYCCDIKELKDIIDVI